MTLPSAPTNGTFRWTTTIVIGMLALAGGLVGDRVILGNRVENLSTRLMEVETRAKINEMRIGQLELDQFQQDQLIQELVANQRVAFRKMGIPLLFSIPPFPKR